MLSKGKCVPGIIHPYTSKSKKPTVPIRQNYWGDTHPVFHLCGGSGLSVVALTQQVAQLLILSLAWRRRRQHPASNNNNCKGDSVCGGESIFFGIWGIKSSARLSFPAHIYAFCLLWWLEVGSVKVTVWNSTNCWRSHAHKHTFTNQTHQWPLRFSSLEQHRLQISNKKSWVKAIALKNCLQLKLAMMWSQILSYPSCLHSCG